MRIIFILLLLMLSATSLAVNNTLLLNKNTHKLQIWILRNISHQDIYLNHPVAHPAASAGWLSCLKAGRYSAIAVNRPNFQLECEMLKKGSKPTPIDCHKFLQVAPVEYVSKADTPSATAWVEEDERWLPMWWHLRKRGFLHFGEFAT